MPATPTRTMKRPDRKLAYLLCLGPMSIMPGALPLRQVWDFMAQEAILLVLITSVELMRKCLLNFSPRYSSLIYPDFVRLVNLSISFHHHLSVSLSYDLSFFHFPFSGSVSFPSFFLPFYSFYFQT